MIVLDTLRRNAFTLQCYENHIINIVFLFEIVILLLVVITIVCFYIIMIIVLIGDPYVHSLLL